jgi:DNA invertase Pin-like site-specific DNA recombinase
MQEQTAEKKIIRVGKYKRCSTDKQELTLQEESLNKLLLRLKEDNPNNDYVSIDYSDEGISGKTTNRPSLKKLVDDVVKHKIDLIIFTKLDRLSRSLQDLLMTTTTFKNNNVNFIVAEQNIDTSTITGNLLFQILGAFAEFERNIINERMKAGRLKASLSGTKSGKPMHRPNSKIDADGVIMKFKNGMSMNAISKAYNVSITPIRRILIEGGLWNVSERKDNPNKQ